MHNTTHSEGCKEPHGGKRKPSEGHTIEEIEVALSEELARLATDGPTAEDQVVATLDEDTTQLRGGLLEGEAHPFLGSTEHTDGWHGRGIVAL